MMMIKAAIYCRVSTEEQAVGGHSIEAQRQELIKYCHAFDYEIFDHYIDAGFSAGTMERPALQKLLQDAGKYQVVIVWRLDRISRDMADLMKILEIFENHRVAFKSKTENFDTSTASGKLMLNMLGSFAEFERASISERIKMAHQKMLNEGKWRGGTPPLGYTLTKEKMLVIVKDEAQIIRKIFDLAANKNVGSRTIAIELNKLGYRTKNGNEFTSSNVVRILNNPTYYGEMIHGRQKKIKKDGKKQCIYEKDFDTYPGLFEPIITKDTFLLAQKNMKKRKLNRGSSQAISNLFGGLIYCADCKGYMLRSVKKNGEKFFTCKNYKNFGTCTHHYISENRIITEIKKAAKNFEENKNEVVKMNESSIKEKQQRTNQILSDMRNVEKQFESFASREDKLFDLMEREIITEEEFIKRKRKLSDKLMQIKQIQEELKNELNNIKTQQGNADFLKYVNQVNQDFDLLSPKEQKAVLANIIERIEVFDNEKPYQRKHIHLYFKI